LLNILKNKKVKAQNEFETKQKLAAYAIQKGFEPALVWEVINCKDDYETRDSGTRVSKSRVTSHEVTSPEKL
jgi:hypothetical protein